MRAYDELWQTARAASEDLSRPAVFTDRALPAAVREVSARRALQRLAADGSSWSEILLRVWVDGGRSRSLEHECRVRQHPPVDNESVDAWLRRLFGERGVSIVLASIDRWDGELARALAELALPLRDAYPGAFFDVEAMLFISRREMTPFGIHVDVAEGLTFHLGLSHDPDKTLLVWPRTRFRELTGGARRSFDLEGLRPHATALRLRPGTMSVVPTGSYYHVSEARSTAIGLVLAFTMVGPRDALSQALRREADALLEPLPEAEPAAWLTSSHVPHRLASALEGVDARGWIAGVMERDRLRRESNGHLRAPPQRLDPGSLSLGARLSASPSAFPIHVQRRGSRLVAWIRGQKLTLPHSNALEELVRDLAAAKRTPVDTLLARRPPPLSPTHAHELLGWFVALGGLRVL